MSKQSEKRERREKEKRLRNETRPSVREPSATRTVSDELQDKNPGQSEAQDQPKKAKAFLWRWPAWLLWCGGLGVSGVINIISNNPRFWYFPAVLLCAFVMIATHRFVQSRLRQQHTAITGDPKSPKPTIQDQIAIYSRRAAARQWQPPEITTNLWPGVVLKVGGIQEMGNNIRTVESEAEADRLVPAEGHVTPIVPFFMNHRLYLKAFTQFGTAPVTITMNDAGGHGIPSEWDKNYSPTAFEIVDDNALPVFQVRYHSPLEVEASGLFVKPNGRIIVAFGDRIALVAPGQPMPSIPERKAWFKYPSSKHLGEYAH